jgi:RimJ/RimL family protein N-acetyltransferase
MEVSIRPLEVSDIDDEFVSWHQNEDGHLDYYTGSRRNFSREDLIEWISGAGSRDIYFFLILVDNNHPIGTIKIGPIDRKNKTSDLVCLVGSRKYTGKGLASRAISIANGVAFKSFDIRRLQGGMYEENVASIKAYCRAGWVIEGRMKGFYWVDGRPMDRICVACFNPDYFPNEAKL